MSKRQRIGDLLVAKGLITRAVAETIAVEAVLADTRFASVLVAKKAAPEADVLAVLSELAGVPAVHLARAVIQPTTIARIPDSVAKRHNILPLQVDGSNLLVAMADPGDQRTIEEVGFATGLSVLPHVALHKRLLEAIRVAYGPDAGGYVGPEAAPSPNDVTPAINAAAQPEAESPEKAMPSEPWPEPEDVDGEIEDEPLELGVDALVTELPAARSERPATVTAATAVKETTAEQRRSILVVDDETDILQLVSNALKGYGHQVLTATRGLEALQLIKAEKPDLIILDAMLPEVHGFEICRKVKESKRFQNTPVLMISAIYRGWRIAADIEALYGVDVFLEKPFRVAELRRRVTALLANAPKGGLENNLSATAQKHYDAAVAAYKLKDYQVAFRELREAEGFEPFSAKIQFMVGRVLEQQERAFQAIYHYERAVELNPSLFPATKNLALMYEKKGFRNKAVEMWERSLHVAPTPEIRDQIKQHLVGIL
jgi:DNA-binding response OmpR family regulator